MIVFLQSQWRRFTVTLIFYVIYSHGWVWPLVQITDYIWIILLSYNIITIYHHCFIPAQWRRFTITVVDYYILKFFYDSSSWINATIFWDWWLHRKYFSEQSYYRYIDIMITNFIWCTLMIDLTIIFILFIANYPNRKNVWKVINLHWINNIKEWCDYFISGSFPPCIL